MKLIKFTFSYKIILVLLIYYCCPGCKHDDSIPEVKPLLRTNPVILGDNDDELRLSGDFILSGTYKSIRYGFHLDLDGSFKNPVEIESGTDNHPGNFESTVYPALKPDVTYYVRTWAISDKYKVFGNSIDFQSKASRLGEPEPIITKVIPQSAAWGDTIAITGKYFDFFGSENKVFINGVEAKTWTHSDTIRAIIPDCPVVLNKFNISVKTNNKVSEKQFSIDLKEIVISGINKTEGQFPDTVIVSGANFTAQRTTIQAGGKDAEIINVTKNSISFIVPYLKDEKSVKIELIRSNVPYTITNNFQYHAQPILNFSKNIAWLGDTIKLYAKNIDFRGVVLKIKNIDQSLTINKKWKDSVEFILGGKYDALQFNIEIQFGLFHPVDPYNNIFITIDQKTIIHKDILLILDKKEFCYHDVISWSYKGMYNYYDNQGFKIKSADGTFNSTYEGFGSYESDIPPGEYTIQLYSVNRTSNIETFSVNTPSIFSVSSSSISRDTRFQILGQYLPNYTNYLFTHLQSKRTFTIRNWWESNGNSTVQIIDPIDLIGSGDYELEIQISGKSFKYNGLVNLNDYFYYVTKLNNPLPMLSSIGCGFTVNNNLYIPQQSGMSIVDLNSGNVRVKDGYYNYDHQPVFLDNKIYVNIYKEDLGRSVLSLFNEITEDWDAVNSDGLPVDFNLFGLGVFNNRLLTISDKGDIYQLDQKWTLLGNVKSDLYFIHYIYSINGNLYLCDFYKGEIIRCIYIRLESTTIDNDARNLSL